MHIYGKCPKLQSPKFLADAAPRPMRRGQWWGETPGTRAGLDGGAGSLSPGSAAWREGRRPTEQGEAGSGVRRGPGSFSTERVLEHHIAHPTPTLQHALLRSLNSEPSRAWGSATYGKYGTLPSPARSKPLMQCGANLIYKAYIRASRPV
jgi:hypothetical protein